MQEMMVVVVVSGMALLSGCGPASTSHDPVKRGEYLVTLASCSDCHTPGHLLGKPDMSKFLGGSDVGFVVPELGYFWGPNLTPDKETGLGNWSEEEILLALREGTRPDGRKLAPMMPWMAYAKLSDEDAKAIVAYLKSLAPISNKAPGPIGASETPTAAYQQVVFPKPVESAAPPTDAAPAAPAAN
ncbi:MAG: cytochrome c [Alphaproteobacteria bacterium]|nr:cytochrome c [Alphaproteobacteria bacterium]